MSISQYFKENKNKYGTVKALVKVAQHSFQRVLGTDKYEIQLIRQREEIDTLFYFLNNYLDISQLKTSDESLRILQECDAIFLSIFDKICKANNLNYWLSWGTLLGAVRHKGFIPWDDDTDVCMHRADFDRAAEILPDVMGKLGIEVRVDKNNPLSNIGLGYMHNKTGIWLDVFYVESYDMAINDTDTLAKRISNYRCVCKENSQKNLVEIKNNMLPNLCDLDKANIIVYSNDYRSVFFHKEHIYPLKKIRFEGVELNVPNDCDSVLCTMYGDEYMKLPRSGVEHHGGEQGKLSTWANKNNINMNEIKQQLIDIYNMLY